MWEMSHGRCQGFELDHWKDGVVIDRGVEEDQEKQGGEPYQEFGFDCIKLEMPIRNLTRWVQWSRLEINIRESSAQKF